VRDIAGSEGATIMQQSFPAGEDFKHDPEAEAELAWLMETIVEIRRIRSGMNIAPGKPLPLFLQQGNNDDRLRFNRHHELLIKLARLTAAEWLDDEQQAPEAAMAMVGEMRLLIPLAGLIDKDAELARLNKEIERLGKGIMASEKKLANSNYVERAPADVVNKEREKLAEAQLTVQGLQEQLAKIQTL